MPRPSRFFALPASAAPRPELLRALVPSSVALGGFTMGSGNRMQGRISGQTMHVDGGGGWKAV